MPAPAPQLSAPAYTGVISQGASAVSAHSAGHYEDGWDRAAMLIGSRAMALEMVIEHSWAVPPPPVRPHRYGPGGNTLRPAFGALLSAK